MHTLPVPCSFVKEAPKPNALSIKSKKVSSFHEFARSTNDAWDIGDDEDEEFLATGRHAALPSSAPTTAPAPPGSLSVTEALDMDEQAEFKAEDGRDKGKMGSRQTNGRVVKSNSEVQLSTATGDNVTLLSIYVYLFYNLVNIVHFTWA